MITTDFRTGCDIGINPMTTDFTLRWAKRYEEVEDVHNGSCRGFSMSEGVSGVACRVGLGVPQGSHLEHLLFHTVLLFKRNNVSLLLFVTND
jgi:hypothetical protein